MVRDKKHLLYQLEETDYSLRGIWLLAILYFGSLIAGAVMSLIAFKLTHLIDPDSSSYLASKPYTRFFDRARWVSVLVILPFLFKYCKLTSFRAIGFARPWANIVTRWFIYGIGMIVLVYASNSLLGAFVFDPNWNEIFGPEEIGVAMIGSILIGTLEEIVFRGLVFRTFYTAFRPWTAILLSSLFFAVLHFKAPSSSTAGIDASDVGIAESISVAWGMIAALITQFNPPYLLTIFLVGVALHQVFLYTGNLWASIGLHAGWVFTIKIISSSYTTGESPSVLSGTTRLVDGYWVSVVLAVFVAVLAYLLEKKSLKSKSTGA